MESRRQIHRGDEACSAVYHAHVKSLKTAHACYDGVAVVYFCDNTRADNNRNKEYRTECRSADHLLVQENRHEKGEKNDSHYLYDLIKKAGKEEFLEKDTLLGVNSEVERRLVVRKSYPLELVSEALESRELPVVCHAVAKRFPYSRCIDKYETDDKRCHKYPSDSRLFLCQRGMRREKVFKLCCEACLFCCIVAHLYSPLLSVNFDIASCGYQLISRI